MYLITWKYEIKPASRESFEIEYGPNGSWNKLFSTSESYLGSYLYKDPINDLTYFLLDTWINEETYHTFKEANAAVYAKLSLQFEQLYSTEEKLSAVYSKQ